MIDVDMKNKIKNLPCRAYYSEYYSSIKVF